MTPTLRALVPSFAALVLVVSPTLALAQARPAPPAAGAAAKPGATPAPLPSSPLPPPPGYVVGADDVLTIDFYTQKELTGDVVVRPDGMITLKLLNDIKAVGLTPAELNAEIVKAASKLYNEPVVTVTVKQINSRRVFVIGEVGKPGPFALSAGMTISQLLSMTGLNDWADRKNILIIRLEAGKQNTLIVNYEDIMRGRNLPKNNIELRPGDTIIVK